MPPKRTARERVRDEITGEIKRAARRHLAEGGGAALSVRAVAREVGLTPSALYRYFPSRDALLTTLITEAYESVADHVESAVTALPSSAFLARWRAACHALRDWAQQHPHEYALIYGSPIPGYAAPSDTITSGSRITLLLLGLVRDAWVSDALNDPPACPPLSEAAAAQADRLAATIGLEDLPRPILLRAVTAWTQLFGTISLEQFGQLKGAFTDNTPIFAHEVDLMADSIGFRDLQ